VQTGRVCRDKQFNQEQDHRGNEQKDAAEGENVNQGVLSNAHKMTAMMPI
jgi:hypothetical protein